MDLTNKEIHYVGYMSSARGSLNRVDSIIALAETSAGNQGTLAACATIVLVVALAQGIQTALSESVHLMSLEDDIDVSDTKAMPFLEGKPRKPSLWFTVQQLPGLLSDNKFKFDWRSPTAKVLKELIETRNELVHIDERAVHLSTPSENIKIENNHVVVSQFFPLTKWHTIKLDQVKEFRQAVEAYFDQVVFPEEGEIAEGSIVITA